MATGKYTGQIRYRTGRRRRTRSMSHQFYVEAMERVKRYPLGEMNRHCTKGLNGGRCSACLIHTLRQWQVDVQAYFRDAAQQRREARKVWLRQTYGMADPAYEAMYAQQGGRCALCGEPETLHRNGIIQSLAVDHSHATGMTRELLCQRCNFALGQVETMGLQWTRRAVQYLKGHMSKTERERFTR